MGHRCCGDEQISVRYLGTSILKLSVQAAVGLDDLIIEGKYSKVLLKKLLGFFSLIGLKSL